MKIKYNKDNVLMLNTGKGSCRLIGGINEVPDEIWNESIKLPIIKAKIEAGELVALKKSKLAEMPVAQAIEYVKGTNNVETLQGWLNDDLKGGVKKAIDAQIAEITKPFKKAEDEEPEDSEEPEKKKRFGRKKADDVPDDVDAGGDE